MFKRFRIKERLLGLEDHGEFSRQRRGRRTSRMREQSECRGE